MLLSEESKTYEEFFTKKYIAPEVIEQKVAEIRKSGKTIATLNGSFDLLHAGHLHMIYEASRQAEVLILALNSDSSIQKYKSPLRPIIPLLYRLKMMAAIDFVDFVTSFEETDPIEILKKIRPDVHVNGSEYGENCIEAETVRMFGGKIHIVQLIPGLSTSEIIKKIQKTCV